MHSAPEDLTTSADFKPDSEPLSHFSLPDGSISSRICRLVPHEGCDPFDDVRTREILPDVVPIHNVELHSVGSDSSQCRACWW